MLLGGFRTPAGVDQGEVTLELAPDLRELGDLVLLPLFGRQQGRIRRLGLLLRHVRGLRRVLSGQILVIFSCNENKIRSTDTRRGGVRNPPIFTVSNVLASRMTDRR